MIFTLPDVKTLNLISPKIELNLSSRLPNVSSNPNKKICADYFFDIAVVVCRDEWLVRL
ncbi:MAG: hypothetical protein RJA25_2215 [Bacteroidota bacterium]|jgi:hypothetical protein